jgi:hypothetical protein
MAGILAIYGLVVAALIANSIDGEYDLFKWVKFLNRNLWIRTFVPLCLCYTLTS